RRPDTHPLSLHDALPIWRPIRRPVQRLDIRLNHPFKLGELPREPATIFFHTHGVPKRSTHPPFFPDRPHRKIGGTPHLRKQLERSEEHTSELQSRENLVC